MTPHAIDVRRILASVVREVSKVDVPPNATDRKESPAPGCKNREVIQLVSTGRIKSLFLPIGWRIKIYVKFLSVALFRNVSLDQIKLSLASTWILVRARNGEVRTQIQVAVTSSQVSPWSQYTPRRHT